MTTFAHMGEARRYAIEELAKMLDRETGLEKAVLVHDLFGLMRVIIWLTPDANEQILRDLVSNTLVPCGRFWTGNVWVSSTTTASPDKRIYDAAWNEGVTLPDHDKLRIDDRTRTRTGWLPRFRVPDWSARRRWSTSVAEEAASEGPPVVVFYSFKGGVGRTTALAGFALQRAREGERVLVIDLDLDAPGAGTLLCGDNGESTLGVVDYMLEAPLGEVRIKDYTHTCKREKLVGSKGGEILMMPAGRVDENYVTKLSRLNLETRSDDSPLHILLAQARRELRLDWILIDSRTGLSVSAGLLLDGTAHLHVLFGTNSIQSQLGLTVVLRHLGGERVLRGTPQSKCIIVQAMVVDIVDVEEAARTQFSSWLETALQNHYLVSDAEAASMARCVTVPYRPRLAFFRSIDDVASDLAVGPYADLASRIGAHFVERHELGVNPKAVAPPSVNADIPDEPDPTAD